MTGYIAFAIVMLSFLIIFILLWRKRKNKNADVNHDPWPGFEEAEIFGDWP